MTVEAFVDAEKLASDIRFSEVDLDNAMMEQASFYAYYAAQAAKAGLQVDNLKNRLEITEAIVAKKMRDDAAASGAKITEKQIESEVPLNKTVRDLKSAYNEAKAIHALAIQALEAFKQRRDMLIQMGVARREEIKGEARVAVATANQDKLDLLKAKLIERQASAN